MLPGSDWPFFPAYDPTTYPPIEDARPSLGRRLATFTTRWLSLTVSYLCLLGAVLLLSGGPS